ncbi:MAG TPA: beta-ketoacyl-[acyl-carrier-protein] synthase family protein [Luteibacter sp.]|uniref:beta-ketoacyl-[acyl-carrier-protein] synthase family protein n=1 Tax=Luteibacter sp. TaxID=1886636 RepID=UPI002C7D6DF4|nr:beta-ketoacyl-[acyl-carrier-protein] synthase family protein [Luteibacter sp.]HVI56416.1 beta-ketoacyl-[acyl-carrier-protein] synthase family protein [Luteibacter sp.]
MPHPEASRVVVTGMGAVSALGNDADVMWRALAAGRPGIEALVHPRRDDLRVKVAAQVKGFDPHDYLDDRAISLMDRVSQFAVVAAREAASQAQLPTLRARGARVAVIIGTGVGGETSRDEESRKLYAEGAARVHPLSIVRTMSSAPASHIAIAFQSTGPTFGVTSACASSNHAIAQAALLIRAGVVDLAIAGGAEACLSFSVLKAWEAMRVLADDTCRPFCLQRRGLVLGEGAGIFVLESLAHAMARGEQPLAELAGVGMSSDAGDIVAPSAEGAAAAMTAALNDAGLEPGDIDHINAHGTGTVANDVTETQAIHRVFGEHASRIAITSTKSMHGHALGAAGALELVATIGALRESLVPPTINFTEADPQCDLDVVANSARRLDVRAALSNSFAFGGLNAVLALRRW